MLTTFDRYLLIRFWHVFGITFVAVFGLYLVIDVFTNAGDLMSTHSGAFAALRELAQFYGYRAFWFFDVFAGTGAVISALVTLSLVLRYGELNPVLSAGIPTYRLVLAPLAGTMCVNLALVANQELIVPRVRHHVQRETGDDQASGSAVEPDYDRATQIHVSGQQIFVGDRRLAGAEFTLPAQFITTRLTNVRATQAVYCDVTPDRPAGWLLRGATPTLSQLDLVTAGQQVVLPAELADEMFIVSDLTPDQLTQRTLNIDMLSTSDLLSRLKSPTYATATATHQSLHLHTRFLRYPLNLVVVLACVPVLMRKETRGILTNLACCAGVMGVIFGLIQGCAFLARSHLLATDLAAWIPLIVAGTFAAWITAWIRT